MAEEYELMKKALITGGAGGLGQALTKQLQAFGWHVIILDVSSQGLKSTEQLEVHLCDLTDKEARSKVVQQVLSQHPKLDLVIYNAGVTQIGSFDQIDMESHRKLFEINYFSAVALAIQLAPAIRAAKGCHLAISSVAGFAPLYHRTSYSASKHALEGFFKSLRSEEKLHGVDVLIAAPSFVATNISKGREGSTGFQRPGSASDAKDAMGPEEAAQEILKGYEKKRSMIPVGRIAKLAWRLNRFFPDFYQSLMEKQISGKD
ncbi:SDR family NAD(P)-dependent oxidoreductase [Sneathiella limimaris]|uniref:SDR family NAD(P)-dependent oxidoreductase n=1 Tax=Sneathiella limimaris TaxID=1964213 RepID=UPI0019D1B58F|nr:SDR family NAD(P)-dependent oxidoreductase [Sneathiella limimaris]